MLTNPGVDTPWVQDHLSNAKTYWFLVENKGMSPFIGPLYYIPLAPTNPQ